MQVVERSGDWARVVFDNEWSAWVDARLLLTGGAPPTAARTGPFTLRALLDDRTKAYTLGGATLLALSTIQPWLRGGGSVDAYKVPAKFLIDEKSLSSGGINLGVVLLAFAAAIVVATAKNADTRIARRVGIAAAAVSVVYVVQLQRLVSGSEAGLTGVVGFGVVSAAVGGLTSAFASQLAATRVWRPTSTQAVARTRRTR